MGTLVMVVVMSITGKPLKTPETPSGIIALELAGNKAEVEEVLTAWGFPFFANPEGRARGFRSMAAVFGHTGAKIKAAKQNTYYDFIFILFYTALFYMLCKATVRWLNNQGHTTFLGTFLSKAVIVSAFLDVIENTGMLLSLSGNISDGSAAITFIASIIKWSIVAITILYLLIFGIYFGIYSRRK
ncbi:hypothetical protein EGI32_06675 [Ferruginibacter sp. HRS2-29]|nr:hypothetical protein [Ferruginibacter sp. HRS2-29]